MSQDIATTDGPAEPDDPPAIEDEVRGPVVLDASAVLAWLRSEPGSEQVDGHLDDGVMSAVNASEVWQKLAQFGADADQALARLRALGMSVVDVGLDDAVAAARLWSHTRPAGLSLADRCCLALAARLQRPALTADAAWGELDLPVAVHVIR